MKKFLLTLSLLLLPLAACADPLWTLQLGTGLVHNFPTPLSARQDGKKVLDVKSADYNTYPLESPYYWSIRVGRSVAGRAWELELIHQKIYLQNKPANTEWFNVSHGYNLAYLNRSWETGELIYRVGGGWIIGHPESRINGRTYEKTGGPLPFDLGGPSAQVAVEKRWGFERGLLLAIEAKITAGYAVFPISGGRAEVPNVAGHLIGTVGWGVE